MFQFFSRLFGRSSLSTVSTRPSPANPVSTGLSAQPSPHPETQGVSAPAVATQAADRQLLQSAAMSLDELKHSDSLFYDLMFGKPVRADSSEEIERKIQQALEDALQNVDEITQNVVQLPALLQQIDRELAKVDYQAEKVAALIEQDPVIAARVLKLANAPTYKPAGSDIVDLQQAVAYIGGKQIQQFVITAVIRQMSDTPPIYFKMFGQQIWQHSQQTAQIARELSRREGVGASAAYLTGLIHDIGKIAIFRILVDVLRTSHPDMTPSSSLFRQALTGGSLKLSFRIAQSWQLPDEISLALRDQYLSTQPPETAALSRVLFQANLYSELIMLLEKSMIDDEVCASICQARQIDFDFIVRFREEGSRE